MIFKLLILHVLPFICIIDAIWVFFSHLVFLSLDISWMWNSYQHSHNLGYGLGLGWWVIWKLFCTILPPRPQSRFGVPCTYWILTFDHVVCTSTLIGSPHSCVLLKTKLLHYSNLWSDIGLGSSLLDPFSVFIKSKPRPRPRFGVPIFSIELQEMGRAKPPTTLPQPLLTHYDHDTPPWVTRLEAKVDYAIAKIGSIRTRVEHIEMQLEDQGYDQGYLTGESRQARKRRQAGASSSHPPQWYHPCDLEDTVILILSSFNFWMSGCL